MCEREKEEKKGMEEGRMCIVYGMEEREGGRGGLCDE